jgi:hypothetical protein
MPTLSWLLYTVLRLIHLMPSVDILLFDSLSKKCSQIDPVLEMKILIYWSESNSSIYFHIVLKKTETFTGPNKVLLVWGWRNGTHREDCWYIKILEIKIFISKYFQWSRMQMLLVSVFWYLSSQQSQCTGVMVFNATFNNIHKVRDHCWNIDTYNVDLKI